MLLPFDMVADADRRMRVRPREIQPNAHSSFSSIRSYEKFGVGGR